MSQAISQSLCLCMCSEGHEVLGAEIRGMSILRLRKSTPMDRRASVHSELNTGLSYLRTTRIGGPANSLTGC